MFTTVLETIGGHRFRKTVQGMAKGVSQNRKGHRSQINPRGRSSAGICSRNNVVGLASGVGNFLLELAK
jgi:hypothetical protein